MSAPRVPHRLRSLGSTAARGVVVVAIAAALVPLQRHAAWADSVLGLDDLTEADALWRVSVRTADVEGRKVHYPTPTRELARALAEWAARPDAGAGKRVALRHLAEARRELADRPGAEAALREWAGSAGPDAFRAWDETARWGARYGSWALAFEAAEKALGSAAEKDGRDEARRRDLATDRIGWARAHPESGEALGLLAARARLFPRDAGYAEEWVRSLLSAGKRKEAEEALGSAASLPEERRLLVASEIAERSGDVAAAHARLEAWVADPARRATPEVVRAYSALADKVAKPRLEALRKTLDERFDPRGLLLLDLYFQGKGRGADAYDLLRQVETRHAAALDRAGWLLLSRLWESIDAAPEAFRSRLAAAKGATAAEQSDDLAALSRLALSAGARALAWGVYADEAYRWAARVDVTPGFFTGGLSFLLTGFESEAPLADLEARRLPERTFATARRLASELERRAPSHAELPALHLAILERHVSRGEGNAALELLPKVDRGSDTVKAEGRRLALLAIRQTNAPLERERALWKDRLRLLAPDGSRPPVGGAGSSEYGEVEGEGEGEGEEEGEGEGDPGSAPEGSAEAQPSLAAGSLTADPTALDSYAGVLKEALSRLSARDRTRATSLALLLGELDRMPAAEELWVFAADEIEGWNAAGEMEGRYRAALKAFEGPGWWNRLARWYARREKRAELRALVEDVVATFRGSELFARDPGLEGMVPAEGQPEPYVYAGDFLRLKALERFPASRLVVSSAEARLVKRSVWDGWTPAQRRDGKGRGVVDDALLRRRHEALLFTAPAERERLFRDLMYEGKLPGFLLSLEARADRTPVEDRLLLEGWARLSRFEQALPYADALAAAYPGDGGVASEALTLHRSLSLLSPPQADAGAAVAAAAAPALADPAPLLTQVGEMWEDLGRPAASGEAFRKVMADAPRDPGRILEVTTLFWDYGRMAEAWEVLSDGRKRISRPRMHAFEAGVLREELRDLPGALDEYLAAVRGEAESGAEVWEAHEWRAQNRLARLLSRPRVRAVVTEKVDGLKPGDAASEAAMVPLLSLLSLAAEEADSWDDWIDAPRDAVGREQRRERRQEARPAESEGIETVGARLLAKAEAMAEKATCREFLQALRRWRSSLLDPRWNPSPEREVAFESRLLLREAELAATEEERLSGELARVRFLGEKGRADAARAALLACRPRAEALPEGPAKVRAFASLASAAEALGAEPAAAWRDASSRYPSSLGILDDHVAFLLRSGRGAEALDLLERAASRAADPHRQTLTRRLVELSLEQPDLPRAKRGVTSLLALSLDPPSRIAAASLLCRLSLKEDPAFDAVAFGKSESAKLPEELRPDLWASLATAARLSSRPKESLALSIEALNRRMDRVWLAEACRSAAEASLSAELLRFFEAQRARSPRDVRWAVAVREIKRYAGDLEGAIAAAREACTVAPERESLVRETVELLERAARFRDAADFVGEWAKTRPADEGLAAWRASLLVRAGEATKGVEVEKAAVAALEKDASDGRTQKERLAESAERQARAARRFQGLRQPRAAWVMAAPGGTAASAAKVPLSHAERAEIALLSGHLPALVAAFGADAEFRSQAAPTLSRLMRPEERAALQEQLLGLLFPAGRPPDTAALDRWWDFAEEAGLHRFREGVARRLLAATPGPWSTRPPVDFVRRLAAVEPRPKVKVRSLRYSTSDFERRWVEYLAARDRGSALEPLLAPKVAQLDAAVAGTAAVPELPFASWFPVDAFVRLAGTPAHEGWRRSVNGWFATPVAWGRFLEAAGKRWETRRLLPLLTAETRVAWLSHTGAFREREDRVDDPVTVRRQESVRRSSEALLSLLEGAPGAQDAPEIVKLRGPRLLGELLGAGAEWTWPEFAPRPADSGEDADAGSGVDALRVPGRLWGARPGEAWYVLEALARLRARDASAADVPLEATARGQEAQRTLLAVRTAEASGDPARALALDERFYSDLAQADRLARRMRLLTKADPGAGRARAEELFRAEVRRQQGRADEALFRAWERSAADLGLPSPLDLLDPATPVSPGLLAFLFDRLGPEKGRRFATEDVEEFRAALGRRWSDVDALPKDRLLYVLDELWANRSAGFPQSALRRLGLFWPEAVAFLSGLEPGFRKDGLAAVRALPDPKGVASLAGRSADRRGATQLLLLKAELLSGDETAAVARLERLAAPDSGPSALRWLPPPAAAPSPEEAEGEAAAPAAAPSTDTEGAGSAAALRQALAVFRSARRPEATARAEAVLAERLRKDQASGVPSLDSWRLAFDLARGREETVALVAALERSFVRGELGFDMEKAAVARLLAGRDDVAAARWVGRIAPPSDFRAVKERADIWTRLKRFDDARREWVEARERIPLSSDEESNSFDEWRRVPAPPGAPATPTPAAWSSALAFWQKKGSELDRWGDELAAHLAASPYDANAARAVLRSLAAAPESAVSPASAALGGWRDVPAWRAARHELPRSPLAARSLLLSTSLDAADLRRRRFPKAEVEGLLSDLARIAVATGEGALAERALAGLEDLSSTAAAPLRAELTRARAERAAAEAARRSDAARPGVRPRDLTWDLYAKALDAEARR